MRLKRAINEFSILPGSSFSVYLEEILPPRVIAACTVMGAPARMIVFREDRSLTIFESEQAYGQSTIDCSMESDVYLATGARPAPQPTLHPTSLDFLKFWSEARHPVGK